MNRRLTFAVLCAVLFLAFPIREWTSAGTDLLTTRNYYGVIRVRDEGGVRTLLHGITNHGGQILDEENTFRRFGYYEEHSGLFDVFSLPELGGSREKKEIAIVGLGTGAVACFYNQPGRHFVYYEIDPAVVEVAKNPEYFTFLSACAVDHILHTGDGRLLIARAPKNAYDMIVLDAFSSDNIPLHIITREAMELYLSKLKPGGILVFHVTNRFFDLEYELAVTAGTLGYPALFKENIGEDSRKLRDEGKSIHKAIQSSKYVVITANENVRGELLNKAKGWTIMPVREGWSPWRDDYANILRSLRR